MEALSLTCVPNTSSSESPKKRTSSPGAPTSHRKKPKMDPGHSDRDKRKRKKKKRPITHDSGTMLGLIQNVRSSSPAPGPPFPSASSPTKNRSSSFVPSQSDGLSGSSLASPSPVRSPSVAVASSQEAAHALLQQERVIPTSPSTSKVRLISMFVSNDVQTLPSLSMTIKCSLRALCPLLFARSVLICFISLLLSPRVAMSHVTVVLSTGSTLINNLMDWKVDASSAKKPVLSAVPWCVAVQ